MDKKIITQNSLETKKLGSQFSKKLKPGDIILLFGNLGSGKTTFVQGIADGLGVRDRIISPTFVLIRSHKVNMKNIKNLNHIDLYRIEKTLDLENLGLDEILKEDDSITIVEWADRLSDFKTKENFKIYFRYLNDNQREIKIGSYESR